MSKVTLIVKPWAGDHAVAKEDAEALFVDAIEVDGFEVIARLALEAGDFASVVIPAPSKELRAHFADPSEYLISSEATLSLPITEIEVRVVTA